MIKHQQRSHKSKCGQCEYEAGDILKRHVESRQEGKQFHCDDCDFSDSSATRLASHRNRMQKEAFPETNHTQSQTNIKHTWRRKTPSKATSQPIFVSKAPLRIHPQPHWDVDEGGRSHLQPQAGSPIHAVQGILPCKLNYRSLPLSATFTAF